MAKVTTRAGDDGYTGLIGAGRVPKYHPRPEALGTLDEATAALGLARALSPSPRVQEAVRRLQRELYLLMAEVATTPDAYEKAGYRVTAEQVLALEELQAALAGEVEIPNAFVIPGATVSSAALDLARSVVRRAERQVAKLLHTGEIGNAETLRYLNRCSDLLHVLARYDEVSQGVELQTQG
ncbi:MAG TPA: cob(I)yrinic acid a,c-diamide adenosyltransferase [Chloroflexota bacterium]|jgi:cob(I)alamin adenosyltransferase|nr:cob(I)yrinic acid a,c-diamide adenosyltransferase [Chloroflexota bacterium]